MNFFLFVFRYSHVSQCQREYCFSNSSKSQLPVSYLINHVLCNSFYWKISHSRCNIQTVIFNSYHLFPPHLEEHYRCFFFLLVIINCYLSAYTTCFFSFFFHSHKDVSGCGVALMSDHTPRVYVARL